MPGQFEFKSIPKQSDEVLKKFAPEQEHKTIEVIETTSNALPTKLNLANIVIRNAAIVVKNLMTTKKIKGVEDSTDSTMIALLDRSEFYKIPSKLELTLNLYRGSSALAVIYIVGIPYIVQLQGTYNKIGKMVTSATGFTDNYTSYDFGTTKVQLGYEWALDSATGRPIVRTVMRDDVDNVLPTPGSQWEFLPDGHKFIPYTPFTNTEDAVPDWTYVAALADNLNFHSNETAEEWQFAKIQHTQNGNFATNNASSMQARILGGERIHSTGGISSKLREPMEVFMAGAGTLLTNGLQVDSLEDKLQKYLFSLRDSLSTGTNKHNTEVATFNQIATDMALFKMERFRNPVYTQFFKDHVGAIAGIKLPDNFKAIMTISEIERNKIDTGKPDPKTPTVKTPTTTTKKD